MGMYTEFVFGVSLLKSTPIDVINILDALVNNSKDLTELTLPNHVFFECIRYQLIATSSSYYFGFSNSYSIFQNNVDSNSKDYLLLIRSNLKNYNNEIELFVDWIRPYIDYGSGDKELLGYKLYEEAIVPYLFYKDIEFEKLVNNNINAGSYIDKLY